ncbi:MAG: TIGR02217 family protein, partial [Pseudolabrys sp.]
MTAFHEVLFPLDISLKSAGGPQRRTDVVLLGSGAEERNARWAHSRRCYDAGYGVKTFEALSQVIAFFEERRGRLYGFRWRDRLDHSSAAPVHTIAPTDQVIGTGD